MKYLVELLLGEPDVVLRLLGGTRLVAELVPRLRENLSTRHHFQSLLHSLTTLVYLWLFVDKQTNQQRMITADKTHSLPPD